MKEKPTVPPRPSVSSGQNDTTDSPLHLAWQAAKGIYPKQTSFKNENDLRSFSQYYNALRAVFRHPPSKRKDDVVKDILQESKIPADISEEIMKLLRCAAAGEVDRFVLQDKPRLVTITDINWRIHVTVSTSYIARSLTPCVQLILTLSDGRVIDIEMTLQKFHLLRHTVASALKEMQLMESRSIMQS